MAVCIHPQESTELDDLEASCYKQKAKWLSNNNKFGHSIEGNEILSAIQKVDCLGQVNRSLSFEVF